MTGGGEPDGGAVPVSDYGDTMFNAEGDDDDCKYHVKWTSTPVRENTERDVHGDADEARRQDAAATGAGVRAEVFLNDTHPAAPPPQATEAAGGKYTRRSDQVRHARRLDGALPLLRGMRRRRPRTRRTATPRSSSSVPRSQRRRRRRPAD